MRRHFFRMKNFRQGQLIYCSLALVCVLVVLHVVCDIDLTSSLLGRDKCHQERNSGDWFDHDFLLAEPETCFDAPSSPRPVFLLVLVASSVGNFGRRQAIRETWGSPEQIKGKNIATVFLLGKDDLGSERFSLATRGRIERESAAHHDIVQADFLDSYHNLTIKIIMGMKWVHTYCPHASYFMKTDDDMYISYANIIKNLSSPATPTTAFAMGHLHSKSLVVRTAFLKFYMPRCMYPYLFYPPYLSGSGYIMSADLAGRIYKTAPRVKFIYFEDAFVGLCLQALGVMPVGHHGYHYTHIDYEFCKFRNEVISTHAVELEELRNMWHDLHHSKTVCL